MCACVGAAAGTMSATKTWRRPCRSPDLSPSDASPVSDEVTDKCFSLVCERTGPRRDPPAIWSRGSAGIRARRKASAARHKKREWDFTAGQPAARRPGAPRPGPAAAPGAQPGSAGEFRFSGQAGRHQVSSGFGATLSLTASRPGPRRRIRGLPSPTGHRSRLGSWLV